MTFRRIIQNQFFNYFRLFEQNIQFERLFGILNYFRKMPLYIGKYTKKPETLNCNILKRPKLSVKKVNSLFEAIIIYKEFEMNNMKLILLKMILVLTLCKSNRVHADVDLTPISSPVESCDDFEKKAIRDAEDMGLFTK